MANGNSDEVTSALGEWAVAKIKAMQSKLVQDIKDETPVDTGTARDGTKTVTEIEKLGDKGLIRNEVPYIGWLEFGTKDTEEHAMFRKGLAKVGK